MLLRLIAYFLLLYSCCLTVLSSPLNDETNDFEQIISRVDALFLSDSEALPYVEVVELSRVIIKNRELYNNNTIAKVFSLLADAAINKGDLARAMQFALDGESLLGIDQSLRLSLLLKVAAGHYFKGKYHQAKEITTESVELAKEINHPRQLIKALSYQAMTNALIAEHQLAFADLQQVEQLLAEHQEFNDHIALLDVLANAYYYLGIYQTSIDLYNKTLKIRYDLSRKYNIEHTYYNLARSYLKLERLDDAYNAFWEAKKYAELKNAPIRIAYAQLGLGQVLFSQQKYAQALPLLKSAEAHFHGQNLTQPYLTTLLNLANLTRIQGELSLSYQYLEQAEKLIENTELTEEQIELYLLISEMYQQKQQFEEANIALRKYFALYKQFNKTHQHYGNDGDPNVIASKKNQEISLKMAEETDLKNQFNNKFQYQKKMISTLIMFVILLIILLLFFAYRIRVIRLNQQYHEIEKPLDYIANPSQTKSFYQHHYKMARRYEYRLAVGYFSIDNWQELKFQFSKKVIAEVARTIARLVNENCDEFDLVGLINDGEYLFLSPHQTPEHLKMIFARLTSALKVQIFANLGEFSLKVSYDCQSPNIQDIDPYIFLSRLSESTRAEYSSYKK